MESEQLKEMIANYEAETDLLNKVRQGSQIASFYSNKLDQYEEAQRYWQEVIRIAEQLQDDKELSVIYNTLGEFYKNIQDPEKAKQTFLQAISYGEKSTDTQLLPRPYINLGNIYVDELNFPQALHCFEEAKVIAERLKDDILIGIAISSIGRAYLEHHDFKQAIKYLRQSLKLLPNGTFNRCAVYVNLGIAYGQLNDDSLSIGYFKRVIPILQTLNIKVGIAEMYLRISEVYITDHRYDKATYYVKIAQDYIEENQIEDHNLECYLCLLFVRLHAGNELIDETEQCIQKFLSLGVTNRDFLFAFYDTATGFYAKQKNYDLASQYAKKFSELERKIFK